MVIPEINIQKLKRGKLHMNVPKPHSYECGF